MSSLKLGEDRKNLRIRAVESDLKESSDMIAPDETNVEIRSRLKSSLVLTTFIQNNKQIDSDDFYGLASEIIGEIYGKLEHKNFRSISHAAPWFNVRQAILRSLLQESGVSITYKPIEERAKLSYSEWFNMTNRIC